MLSGDPVFVVGPNREATADLRGDADRRLLRSLLYLVDRAATGMIVTDGIAQALSDVLEQVSFEQDVRVRAIAYEVHHLLHRALLDGDPDEVESVLGILKSVADRFATRGIEIRGYSQDATTIGAGISEDAIFERIIRPEYEITSPTPADLQTPDSPNMRRTHEYLEAGLQILRLHDRPSFEEVGLLVTEFTVLRSATIKAGTSIRSYGRVWLAQSSDNDDVVTCIEAVVHEVAHLYLYLLQLHDPLLTNGSESGYGSPFRPDPRPLSGIYHAMFVLARTIRCLRILGESTALLSELPAEASAKLTDLRELQENFSSVESIIREHAHLTPRGLELLQACRGLVVG